MSDIRLHSSDSKRREHTSSSAAAGQNDGQNDPHLQPAVLRPFHRDEAMTVAEAAQAAPRSKRTIREWCALHDVGRHIKGRWAVSRVALQMVLEDDWDALKLYLDGNRSSPSVVAYFERCGVPLARQSFDIREHQLSELNGSSRP